MTNKRPHLAEAIQTVRDRYADTDDALNDMPDEAVAKLGLTRHVEFRLARREFYRAVSATLPARVRRWFGETT